MPATPEHGPTVTTPVTLERIGSDTRLRGASLSDWFDPFLPLFAREAVACGGQALVAVQHEAVVGLLLTDPAERTASVFARGPGVAARLAGSAEGFSIFTEADLGAPSEEYTVFTADLATEPAPTLRHPVRVVSRSGFDRVVALLEEMYGPPTARWARVAREEGETCLAVEAGGSLAGVAWVQVVGSQARLHTLSVRTGFRRTGIGSDLLTARLLWARQAGATRAVSEISEHNPASRAVAERAGMRPAGRVHLYARPAPPHAAVRPLPFAATSS